MNPYQFQLLDINSVPNPRSAWMLERAVSFTLDDILSTGEKMLRREDISKLYDHWLRLLLQGFSRSEMDTLGMEAHRN
mgnify:CR=1 FL=1